MAVKSSVPGVIKEILYGGRGPPPQFIKNSKAVFHYRAIRLLPDGSLPENDVIKSHVIDDTRTLGSGPFELLIGREFKLYIWETLIRDMLLGEVARFSCPHKLVSEYPTVSQALRKIAKQKHHDDEKSHTHHCGFSSMLHGSGHTDLDLLTQERLPIAFEIELLKVVEPGDYEQYSWAMSDAEKSKTIPLLREEGNALFKSGQIQEASDKYFKALGFLESLSIHEKPGSEAWNNIERDKVPFLLNYSQCQLSLKNYPEVIRQTSTVLEFDPINVKALFRRGKAFSASWSREEAERDFKRVLELDPSLGKTVDRELKSLNERMKAKEEEERKRLQGKMF